MIHTVDVSQIGSNMVCVRKNHTTVAAICALLFTTVILLPVYLVLGQQQQRIDLSRLNSSYQVCCCQTNTMQEANLPMQSHVCCSLVTPSTAAVTKAHTAHTLARLCIMSQTLMSCSACMRMAVPRHAYVYLTMLYYTRVGCHMYIQVTNRKLPSQSIASSSWLACNPLPGSGRDVLAS